MIRQGVPAALVTRLVKSGLSSEDIWRVLPDEQRRKIVHDTGARLYGLN
jgi:hypothetical protein